MATIDDLRAITRTLPQTVEGVEGHGGGLAWRVGTGLYAWERGPRKTDLAALEALGREWPPGVVIGVRTEGEETKEALLASFPDVMFTIPHFDGYPAVLIRLDDIAPDLLAEVVSDAWLVKAPKRLATQWLADRGLDEQ